jgi:hypothetical protein
MSLASVPWQAISMVVDCMWFFSRCHWQHPVISNNNNPKQLLERFCDQKLLAAAGAAAAAAWT